MAIWGADVEQLRQLGSRLQTGASEIEAQKNTLTKVLAGTDWKGPDADEFRREWSGTHTAMLTKVAEALKEAGNQAKRNAEQQFQTSQG